ncbi:uncharacterized protein LOC124370675 [Homalodisca vitripennis]|uniref:uncharacterized protein LOC124370675 n=1 Tax=Homalodisca vitripennis TaxID=197043 RepID=UPI001EEBD9C5|nr:uncharacterized protein LOC124370675 [Homalodisca vitripennis]
MSSFDVVILAETNLSVDVDDAEVLPKNFSIYRCDRSPLSSSKSGKGGVMVAIRDAINSTQLYSEINDIEHLLIELKPCKYTSWLLVACYIPPQQPPSRYNSLLQSIEALMSTGRRFDEVVVVGDFNLPGIDWNGLSTGTHSPASRVARSLMDLFQLYQINQIYNSRDVMLDLILSSNKDINVSLESDNLLPVEERHHPPLSFEIHYRHINQSHLFKRHIYDLKRCNLMNVHRSLLTTDFHAILSNSDLNRATNSFISTVSNIVKANSPHIQRVEAGIPNNFRLFWSHVNSTRKSSSVPSQIVHNGVVAEEPLAMCEAFKDFFSSVFTKPTEVFVPSGYYHLGDGVAYEFTPEEVLEKLRNLNDKKGWGPDGIPPGVLKYSRSILAIPVCHIFNTSLAMGIFPEAFKAAYVVPIHKSGPTDITSNYRPISILSAISKVFEDLFLDRIRFRIAQLTCPQQHGFSPGRSTLSNLMLLQTQVQNAFANGKQLDTIYLDFSKAFDTVDHALLLKKISALGFDDISHVCTEQFSRNVQCASILKGVSIEKCACIEKYVSNVQFSCNKQSAE